MSGSLVNSPAEIISQLLINLGLGTDSSLGGSWPVHYSGEPNDPDNVITVYDAVGRQDGRFHVDGERQEHHGFQIRIRATSYSVGYTKARAIAVALDESVQLNTVTIDANSYKIYSISRTTDVLSIGKDHPTTNLNLFTINAVASLQQTA